MTYVYQQSENLYNQSIKQSVYLTQQAPQL